MPTRRNGPVSSNVRPQEKQLRCVTSGTPMKTTTVIALMFLIVSSSPVNSATYRCEDNTGKVIYTDQPCANPKSGRQISIVDNSTDSTEFRQRIQRDTAQSTDRYSDPAIEKGNNAQISRIGLSGAETNCIDATKSYGIEVSSIRKDLPAMWSKLAEASRQCNTKISILPEHARLDALNARKINRRTADPSALPPANPSNLYIPKQNGYISPNGEFCAATKGGAMCPTGGFVRIY